MAKAEIVKETVQQPVEVDCVQLTLSFEEARAIQAVFSRIGGSPEHSPRGYVYRVSRALEEHVGYTTTCATAFQREGAALNGRMMFADYADGRTV